MSYSYGDRRSHYQDLKEDVTIANQRITYIRQVGRYRAEGKAIFYQDETWANRNITPTKVWLDADEKGGLKVPAGKGERSIICHVGGASGFVDGAKLIFRGKKSLKDSDYHTEMNADVFLDWLERKVFPAMPTGSVLVIDRASYHTTLTEESKPAASKFTNQHLAQCLLDHGIQSNGCTIVEAYMALTRIELAALCKVNKPKPVYRVVELAQRRNCNVLFLPVAHLELNPIKMVWAHVKGCVARNNVDFSLVEVERLAHAAIDEFGSEEWTKYVRHSIEIEEKYMAAADETPLLMESRLNRHYATTTDPFIMLRGRQEQGDTGVCNRTQFWRQI